MLLVKCKGIMFFFVLLDNTAVMTVIKDLTAHKVLASSQSKVGVS